MKDLKENWLTYLAYAYCLAYAIFGIYYRISHPHLTETQLSLTPVLYLPLIPILLLALVAWAAGKRL